MLDNPETTYSQLMCLNLRFTEVQCLQLYWKHAENISEILGFFPVKEAKKHFNTNPTRFEPVERYLKIIWGML